MESTEAFEQFTRAREASDRFARLAAVLIAVLVALLAIASIGANRASTRAILDQGTATDDSNRLEARQIRNYLNANDAQILTILSAQHGNHGEAMAVAARFRRAIDTRITFHLSQKLAKDQHARENSERRHEVLQYAEAAFQIGIVLTSAAIAIGVRGLITGSVITGIVGIALMIDGFFAVTPWHL